MIIFRVMPSRNGKGPHRIEMNNGLGWTGSLEGLDETQVYQQLDRLAKKGARIENTTYFKYQKPTQRSKQGALL